MSHQLTFEPSGHHCKVETGETILHAALNAGFLLPYSCGNGSCGSCKGRIVEGAFDHGDAMESVLTPAERAAGLALFCCAKPLSDLRVECRELEAPGEIKLKKLPGRIRKMSRVAPDVMLLELELPDGKRLQFLPGQYIDILLENGQRRAFSMANAPLNTEVLELHVRHIPGGLFTGHVFSSMREQEELRIEGPHGEFYLRELEGTPDRPLIFVAGSTGFAPVKSMVEYALHRGINRPMFIYWGARTVAGLYMHELALEWARNHGNIHYIPVVSMTGQGEWAGRTGLVHQAVLEDFTDLSDCDVYICGSEAMTKAARGDFFGRGLTTNHLYCDVFCAARSTEPPVPVEA